MFAAWIVRDGARHEVHQLRCREHGDRNDQAERDHDERQQPVGIRLAAVLVVLHGPHELRNEDRVQAAADGEDVDHRGKGVRDGEGVTEHRRTESGGDHEAADEAGQAGHQGARGHQRARLQYPRGLATGLRRNGCRSRLGLRGRPWRPPGPLLVAEEVGERVLLPTVARSLRDQVVHPYVLGGTGVVPVREVPGGACGLRRRCLGPDPGVGGVLGSGRLLVEGLRLLIGARRRWRV